MKILVVKLGALGDVLRVTPVIHSLHDGGHDIDVVTSAVGTHVLRNNPYVKRIYRIRHKKNVFELLFLKRVLQKNRYEHVINFESFEKVRTVFKDLHSGKYVGCEDVGSKEGNVNSVFYEYIRELMKPGAPMYSNELFPTGEDKKYVAGFLGRFGNTKKMGIHVGTSKTNRLFTKNFFDVRLWPIDNYIELIQKLVEKQYAVFLTGSLTEKTINEKIVKSVGHPQVVDTSGKFNVQQLQVLIASLDCFVSGDTGPAHVAASVPVRQICLCGPTDANHSAPRKDSNLFLIQKNPGHCPPCYATDQVRKRKCRKNTCMTNISVEDVLKVI